MQFNAIRCGLYGLLITSVVCASQAISAGRDQVRTAPNQQDYYTTLDSGVSEEALKRADNLRLKTISSIGSLLDSPKTKKHRKFELYLRLGELYSERHDFLRDQEFRKYEQRHSSWIKRGKKGKEPKLSAAKSRRELTKAVNAFRDLVRTFPRHQRTDAALFSLAKTMGRLGNDNAVMYFERLIRNHKRSKYIPDAYVALGEYYFEKNSFDKSIDAYQNVLKYKNHKSYPYAVYKLGWAFYNKSSADSKLEKKYLNKSIAAFKLVIKLEEQNAKRHGVINIKEEALKDLIMVWAETENIKDAWSYFASVGKKAYFYDMLSALGGIYYDNGKNKNAIKVYSRLLDEAQVRDDNPKIHSKLIDLYAQIGDLKSVVREIDKMNLNYVRGSPWTIRNAKQRSVMDSGALTAELYTHRYGTLYHQKGQKTKQKVYSQAAEDIYKSYLKTFPEHKNAYDIEFYLADIQYDFKNYKSAMQHFTNVAKKDPKKGKHLKDAAYNAVLSMVKLDQGQKYAKLPKAGTVKKPINLPKTKQDFITVIDNYVSWLPKQKDGHPMKFTAAKIYYDYGHYDEAIKRFSTIAEDIPRTVQGKSAIKTVLGHYAVNKDWVNTITWSRQFAASKVIAKAGHRSMISDILKAALFSRALELEKQEKYVDAAKSFVGFQSEFPKDNNADKALYNATLSYYRVGEVEKALAAGKKLLDSYPKSKLMDEVLINSAQTYESLAQFDQAAKYYERYARNFSRNKEASGALYNAALLNKGLHKFDKAVLLFELFSKRYSRDELVSDALLEAAELKERLGDHRGAIVGYTQYASVVKGHDDDKLHAEAKAAALMARHISASQGLKKLEKLRKILTAKGAPAAYDARSVVAKVYFTNLDHDFSRFNKIKIDNPDIFEKQVEAKQNSLLNLADGYQKVIELANAEYTVASLYRLGEVHEQFSNDLLAVPTDNKSQMEIDSLRTELERLALPLKDEALKFFETAHQRSAEVLTLSPWTKRVYDKLAEMNLKKYPEVIEKIADAEYMSHKLEIDNAVAKLAE